MNYYDLKGIVLSEKAPFAMKAPTESFRVMGERHTPYIEPAFEKVDFDHEKPTVLLISAVGATGKSALARVLSYDAQLPLLDLAKHKPVGANTVTGLLTAAYDIGDISAILRGLATGTFGLVIDGLDEGYSKTSEKAFEAFLDDIATLGANAPRTSFVLLGRSRTVEHSWAYLGDKGIRTGLATISPFSLDGARAYINAYADQMSSPHQAQYQQVRDLVLEKLRAAFQPVTDDGASEFLSFIGYPPVLDAVATLLKTESNFHALLTSFKDQGATLEVELLLEIANYILMRERTQKVLPNIVSKLIASAPLTLAKAIERETFLPKEQCLRLLAHCLREQLSYPAIPDSTLNALYERELSGFFSEHPFLKETEFRNPVFESVALATLLTSPDPGHIDLIRRYAAGRKHSYYLVYMSHLLAEGTPIPAANLNLLIAAAMEFRSARNRVNLAIEATDPGQSARIQVDVEISLDKNDEVEKIFTFESEVGTGTSLVLGPKLEDTYITVPCDVELAGAGEVELTAPIEIEARAISIRATSVVLRTVKDAPVEVSIAADRLTSTVEQLSPGGADLEIALTDPRGVSYPLIQYVTRREALPRDPQLSDKYFRLKRILMEFRSHSKGSLAKYRAKIEHERVLKNDLGRRVLDRLVADGVLFLRGSHYHVNPAAQDRYLGTTWQDLRRGQPSDTLLDYLRSI